MTITVNGVEKNITKGIMTYEDIVKLAEGKEGVLYTVTFTRGMLRHRSGTLSPGTFVPVVPRMIFNVVQAESA
jgi:hypothetical protein